MDLEAKNMVTLTRTLPLELKSTKYATLEHSECVNHHTKLDKPSSQMRAYCSLFRLSPGAYYGDRGTLAIPLPSEKFNSK